MAEENDFEPKLGRPKSRGGKQARKYLGRILAAANLARGGARANGGKAAGYSGARHGRGAGVGRLLSTTSGRAFDGRRRVVIKASIVRLAGKGAGAAAAHLRYLQRDGTTREGDGGKLYGRDSDDIDRAAFRERGAEDRHQFRFIVSAEDGAEYEDLKPLTRRLMEQVEQDLGTSLDWVAVDHFNTGHPHTHIVVRGKDDRGADLVIAKDYLTVGMRERAIELVDLDLGPRSQHDIEATLRAEVTQERLTSIDRALLRGMAEDREVRVGGRSVFDQSLRAGRLAKLAKLDLAEPIGGGRWRLAEGLEDTLRRMGERGDIIRTLQREIGAAGLDRPAADRAIYAPDAPDAAPIVGRVVVRGLADEHADRHYLVIDGTDGRAHYVPLGRGGNVEALPEGAIVRVTPQSVSVREVDRTIAAVAAANGGQYDVDAHLRHDPTATQDYAESHVRRLEAVRRSGAGVERDPSGVWSIADDHLARVERWEAARVRAQPVAVEILSRLPVDKLVDREAATWLDREAVADAPTPVRDAGFGRDLRDAMERRRQWIMEQELGDDRDGTMVYRPDALARLQRREVQRVAAQLAEDLGKPVGEAAVGARVDGVMRRSVDLVSARFALVERSRDFVLVPWRPVLERQIGKPVSGLVREGGVSWTIGRGRGGPSIS
jgi:type IV secretory pathway VirD2 relaxase